MTALHGRDLPLDGFQIAVTSYRRAEDLVDALTRRGARVLHTPVLRMVPPAEDEALLTDTRAIIAGRPDTVVVTTGYGLRRWLESADAAGLLEALMEVLRAARLLIRGPKARGAVRAAGLDDANAVEAERTGDLIDLLLAEGAAGRSVAVQLYGYTDEAPLAALRAAGGQVRTVEPYRWAADDASTVDDLVAGILAERIDAITFTSAPAVDTLLGRAQATGRGPALLDALRRGVAVTAAVGPVTAAPLEEAGITPVVPDRHRMGALIRELTEHLVDCRTAVAHTPAGFLEVRGRAVRLAGRPVPLSPDELRILTRLVAAPGRLVTREELRQILPEGTTDHGLDVTISRLRSGLPEPKLIRTVVKRGYLLEASAPPEVTVQPG